MMWNSQIPHLNISILNCNIYLGQIIRSAEGPLKNYPTPRSRPLNRQDPVPPTQEDGMKIDGISKNRLHSSRLFNNFK